MAKPTLVTVTDKLYELRAKETAYKVEVDGVKVDFSRAFEADRDAVREKYVQAGKYRNLTDAERVIETEMPYEVRHWYGKKYSTLLADAPETAFIDAVRSHRNRWRPLYMALLEQIERQVKGRVPRPVDPDAPTRTQRRAICACCFREIAVNDAGFIHDHGFDIGHGFRNGTCSGANVQHFGTQEGRDACIVFRAFYRKQAEKHRKAAADFESGERVPVVLDRNEVRITNLTIHHIREAIREQEFIARQLESYAKNMDGRIATWVPADPRDVQVPA